MKPTFFLLGLASLPLLAPLAQADSMTGYQVAVATRPNGDLEIRTTEIWNGDDLRRSQWTYGMEQIVYSSCDEKWSCIEDKGSARARFFGYPKIKGWGFVLVRVAYGYESTELDKVWIVDHENHKTAVGFPKLGCHDLHWSKDGSQLILSDTKESAFFDSQSGGLVSRGTRDESKLGALLRRNECPG